MGQETTPLSVTARIGARSLNAQEIQDTLPTYVKLKEQIEHIRANYSSHKSEKEEFHQEQTTNNLSILGPRGSGKSSVLKTLYKDLQQDKKDNKKNILLPPIVPENMEKHLNFMSCLLGLLKSKVDEISSHSSQCPPKKSELEVEYDNLLKTYLYLQEPYQKISVAQYSTQAEYTRTMQAMFQANNNFIHQFKSFIDHLVHAYGDEALLFVFIDDIDLSAYRCADLVKTLLSYLAHPAIVTVLAGDIEIFGEALTLNFLRQEDALDGSILEKSYLIQQRVSDIREKDLLERKKVLAYDYLKKVMPPMYRHFINIWSLNQRGSFCPSGLLQTGKDHPDNATPTLEELLNKLGQKVSQLQGYFDAETAGQHPVALYHLFDNTARGLVNAYAAIQQFCMGTDETDVFPEKVLMEALVASNYELNRYHDSLFQTWIHFGMDAVSTEMKFDLVNKWLENSDSSSSNDEKVDRFRIFTYLDWSAKLLGKEELLHSEAYLKAKSQALLLLCTCGEITDQQGVLGKEEAKKLTEWSVQLPDILPPAVAYVARTLFCLPYPLAVRYAKATFLSGDTLYQNLRKASTSQDSLLQTAKCLICFMDLVTAYYHQDQQKIGDCLLGCPDMLSLLNNLLQRSRNSFMLASILREYIKTMMNKNSLCAYYVGKEQEERSETVEKLFDSLRERCACLSKPSIVSDNQMRQYFATSGFPNFDHLFWSHRCRLETGDDGEWALIPFFNYLNREFLSKISTKVKEVDHIVPISAGKMAQSCQKAGYNHIDQPYPKVQKEFLKRLAILQAIDETGCWTADTEEETPVHMVQQYVFSRLQYADFALRKYVPETTPQIDISCSYDAFLTFQNSYKGKSNTVAKQCCNLLLPLYQKSKVSPASHSDSYTLPVTVDEYIYMYLVLDRLVSSRHVRYGRGEARNLLRALSGAVMTLPDVMTDQNIKHRENYLFWFHCYCRYRVAVVSEDPYAITEKIFSYQELLDRTIQEQDNEIQANYLMEFSEKSKLSQEQIRSIPELFA